MTGQINPNRIAKLLLEGKSCGNCKYAANNLMNMNTLSTAPGVITMCMKPEGDFLPPENICVEWVTRV